MRLSDFIRESFDTEATIDWAPFPVRGGVEKRDQMRGTFMVDKQKFEIVFTRDTHDQESPNNWSLLFQSVSPHGYVGTGNTGNSGTSANKVFGVVVNAIRKFISEVQPRYLEFSGRKDGGKADLYTKMSKVLAPTLAKIGYECRAEGETMNSQGFSIVPLVK